MDGILGTILLGSSIIFILAIISLLTLIKCDVNLLLELKNEKSVIEFYNKTMELNYYLQIGIAFFNMLPMIAMLIFFEYLQEIYSFSFGYIFILIIIGILISFPFDKFIRPLWFSLAIKFNNSKK